MIINRKDKKYEIVIGVEVHTQLSSNSKLFSTAKNKFTEEQNTNLQLFDLGMPGILPLFNKHVAKIGAKVGFAVNGNVQEYSRFDRKHYFYPDLPLGYQITQFYHPIVKGGYVKIFGEDGKERDIEIDRIHIEQDAGKLIHDRSVTESYIDYNRAGVPLLEIVSTPQLRSPAEAVAFLKELRSILRAVNASDADMEKGSFRCDANVSVSPLGSSQLGVRCEIKNLNSFKFVAKAIEYEANRQVDMIESGKTICQQTRLFNTNDNTTSVMREKSDAVDYRYFPDPDLPPVIITKDELDEIKNHLPELPFQKRARYINQIGLSEKEVEGLMSEEIYSVYFDHLLTQHEAKFALGWVMTELIGALKKLNLALEACHLTKENLMELLNFITGSTISSKIAKNILLCMLSSKKSAGQIIEEQGLKQLDNLDDLKRVAAEIISNNPSMVDGYKKGKTKLLGFFVGEVMKVTKGKANPAKTNEIIKSLLK